MFLAVNAAWFVRFFFCLGLCGRFHGLGICISRFLVEVVHLFCLVVLPSSKFLLVQRFCCIWGILLFYRPLPCSTFGFWRFSFGCFLAVPCRGGVLWSRRWRRLTFCLFRGCWSLCGSGFRPWFLVMWMLLFFVLLGSWVLQLLRCCGVFLLQTSFLLWAWLDLPHYLAGTLNVNFRGSVSRFVYTRLCLTTN